MSFRKTIKNKFGVDLPIKGGFGTSIEHPIIIDETQKYNYVSLEKKCINYACRILQMDWVMVQQELIEHKRKSIDILKIRLSNNGDFENNYKTVSFYFDISDCIKYSMTVAEVNKVW
ncbi:hypothetical protein SAMN04488062_102268 [Flavobacterium omnivorum]|uniref:Uncharacterized protein n=1 Tax=Flavobacterium omnivorum TaxID=178355 RepID=A0A1G7XDE1_9FLAO|nr:hypothetical protein [Flavobacterium omnivorum]SDG82252.1 hypothetical protein SAMN04488062_102268 [Flavobacterium omnivorum]